MKSSIRLVQRKFAQGVPVPPSHIAPLPPERKEPAKERTVYHSRMSARSLLDIVALQNIHTHKQPMVLVERLRVDAIRSTSASAAATKRRPNPKGKNNSMCLRPRADETRKRKTKEGNKVPSKKRARIDDLSTDDDTPLLYLRKNPVRPVEAEMAEDSGAMFKRPTEGCLLRYRQFQRRRSITPSFHTGRRSTRQPAAARPLTPEVPPLRRAPRARGLPGKPKAVIRKHVRRNGIDMPVRKPAEPGPVERTTRTRSGTQSAPAVAEAAPAATGPVERTTRTRARTLSAPAVAEAAPAAADGSVTPKAPVPTIQTNGARSPGPVERTTRTRSGTQSAPAVAEAAPAATDGPIAPRAPVPPTIEANGAKSPRPAERTTRTRSSNQPSTTADTPVAAACSAAPADPQSARPCPSNAYNSVQEVVVAATSQCPQLSARCRACRGCGIVGKILQLTELVRADNPTAVYDFNTELDEAMCPSLACLRVRRRLARAAGEHLYLDLLPPDMPQIIQILCKKTVDKRLVSAVSVVDRDVAASAGHRPLLEHEHLLDQLLECMGRRAHAQPGEPEPAPEPEPEPPAPAYLEPAEPTEELVDKADDVTQEEEDAEPGAEAGPVPGTVADAPVFRPTPEEFTDPIAYYTKIQPEASKYGLCKIVPPAGFDHPCNINDHIRFAVIYQYISKLYSRWGPVARELAAIKAHLRTQSVVFARPPLLDGREVNLPRLYHTVERHGGIAKVIQKKRWSRVAEEMKLTKLQNPERKLDQIYMRYLLPYATLSNQERQEKMTDVEKYWTNKYQKMLARARNPLHRQKRLLGESESSSDSGEDDTDGALQDAEDCIVRGRTMNLATFKKIASSLMEAQFPAGRPHTGAVERAYWRAVLLGTDHVVANTAALDTGEEGHGFPKDGQHPWNLKMLANNKDNVLRYLGPVLGVTVPTLHLSMLFSTSCWHRDPHGLPWVEYMHSGPDKIWYGIPSSQSSNFRRAVETLCPAYCQNKSIWLASDIAMIPPEILSEHGVALARAEQRPGEFVMVFPEAHSCSITTGFAVSESVYFAPCSWLDTVQKLFQELRDSCEPTMFSLEQLLLNGARAGGRPPPALAAALAGTLRAELRLRAALQRRGVQIQILDAPSTQPRGWHARAADECQYCRASLFLSKVVGLTARRTALCPEHAARLLDADKYRNVDAATLELHSAFPKEHLEAILTWLEP